MMRRAVLLVAFLALAATAPAPAQSPARAQSRLPSGIPGFLDPATGNFLPLPGDLASPGKTVSGVGRVGLTFNFASFVRGLDSVDCTMIFFFGNLAGHPVQFFANHTTEASFNFAARHPPPGVSIPFSYTPNGNGKPQLRIKVTCRLVGFGEFADEEFDYNLPSGSFDTHLTVDL
jgi:hypothetical protein